MSDLAATNCGGCGECNGGCSSCFWIIILLLFCGCGNNNSGFFNNGGCGNGCDSCLWIILLLLFCGGNNGGFFNNGGCGNNCGCGC